MVRLVLRRARAARSLLLAAAGVTLIATALLTSLTAVIGGVVGFFALQTALAALPFALAVAAASLLYVAVADLIPGLHRRVDPRSSITQVLLIGCGIAIIAFAENHAH